MVAYICLYSIITQLPMHYVRKNEINKNLSIFEDTLGGSERLLSSPVPLFYSRHTARFLATWLLALPFGLYSQFGDSWNHSMMIPATAFISVCLFGIEELATQLEEPFTILPMQGFCDKIGANCDEIVSWAGQGSDEEEALASTAAAVETGYDQVAKVQDSKPKEAAKTGNRLSRLKNRIKRRLGLKRRLTEGSPALK